MMVSYLSLGAGALAVGMTLQCMGVPVIHPPQLSPAVLAAGRRLFGGATCTALAAAGGQVLYALKQGADVLLLPRDTCLCLSEERLTPLLRTIRLENWGWRTVYRGVHGLAGRQSLRVKFTAWRFGRAVNRAVTRLVRTALRYVPREEQQGQIRQIVADTLSSLMAARTVSQVGEIVQVGLGRIYACPQRPLFFTRRVGVWVDKFIWSQPFLLLNICRCLAEMGLEMVPMREYAASCPKSRIIAFSSCRRCIAPTLADAPVAYINNRVLEADNIQVLGREIAACLKRT